MKKMKKQYPLNLEAKLVGLTEIKNNVDKFLKIVSAQANSFSSSTDTILNEDE